MKRRFPFPQIGWFKGLFAIAIAVQWGILSALIMGYEAAGYIDPFSATILKSSFTSVSVIVFSSILFLIEGKKEKKTVTLSFDQIAHFHKESSNEVLAEMSFRDSLIQLGDQKQFARRIMDQYAEKNSELLSQCVVYDPRLPVTSIQAIATIFVLVAVLFIGLVFVNARAFGWIPALLNDEKLFSSLNNWLTGVIVVLNLLNSRLFGIKQSDW